VVNAQTAVLDRTGETESAPAGTTAPDAPAAQLVVTQWRSEAVRPRLAAVAGLDFDDAGRSWEAALIVVSSRTSAGASTTVVSDTRAANACPIDSPAGLDGMPIPLAAGIIAVDDALDPRSVNGTVPERPTAAAIQTVMDGAGSRFDPGLVQTCIDVFGSG
jgi:hypothetical protein